MQDAWKKSGEFLLNTWSGIGGWLSNFGNGPILSAMKQSWQNSQLKFNAGLLADLSKEWAAQFQLYWNSNNNFNWEQIFEDLEKQLEDFQQSSQKK